MLDDLLSTVITANSSAGISFEEFALCTVASLLLGLGAAAVYMFRSNYSKSFVVTLALLPAIVQVVIMMVNGNVGTGLAVMGAFSLVRFRSVPGSAKEIGAIFLAMALGLSTGMGYIGVAAITLVFVGGAWVLLFATPFGNGDENDRELKITVPEDLDYTDMFDDILKKYTASSKLLQIKTTNMGSLFRVTYSIRLRDPKKERAMIDELRCRNGNLTISCGRAVSGKEHEL